MDVPRHRLTGLFAHSGWQKAFLKPRSPWSYMFQEATSFNVFMLGSWTSVTRCLSTVSDEVFYVRMVLNDDRPRRDRAAAGDGLQARRAHARPDRQRQQRKRHAYGRGASNVRALICDSYDAGPGKKVWFLRVEPSISCEKGVHRVSWGTSAWLCTRSACRKRTASRRRVLNPMADCDVNDVVMKN